MTTRHYICDLTGLTTKASPDARGPVVGLLVLMRNRNDDDLCHSGSIDDTEWKALDQTAPRVL